MLSLSQAATDINKAGRIPEWKCGKIIETYGNLPDEATEEPIIEPLKDVRQFTVFKFDDSGKKRQKRFLMLTNQALYSVREEDFEVRRRIAYSDITSIKTQSSDKGDWAGTPRNYPYDYEDTGRHLSNEFIIHVVPHILDEKNDGKADLRLESARKSEIIGLISELYQKLTKRPLKHETVSAHAKMEFAVLTKEQAKKMNDTQRDLMRDGKGDEILWHETQELQYCLLHAVNALLGGPKFTTLQMDDICRSLESRRRVELKGKEPKKVGRWDFGQSNYKSGLGTGNYHEDVLHEALSVKGYYATRYNVQEPGDDEKSEKIKGISNIDLTNDDFFKPNADDKIKGPFRGFILNVREGLMNGRHWFTIKPHRHPKTGLETWYNLDSKKPKPQWFESAKHATRFIQRELREKGGEMLICREKPLPIYKRPMLDQKDGKDNTNEHGDE